MKADASWEQRFMAGVEASAFTESDLEPILRRLNDWLAQLCDALQADPLAYADMRADNALARQAKAIDLKVKAATSTWSRQWIDIQPALALAEGFGDKVILLVFGKFNAGKSSLCNFLADRFAAHGKTVRSIHIEEGHIVQGSAPLREGATETTARLQGVLLGEKLLLLDTPGLHSTTQENTALTQRFTDSADGVLWLTNSASPGQVQELEELTRELRRAKPLLPVVTRSDRYEEDEIDGELVKRLRNKTVENRALQEADVVSRARDKLAAMGVGATQLRPPVSISIHMARGRDQTPAAMTEAGFERLYAALLAIVEPALAYKRRKPAEALLHHLEETVVGALRDEITPALTALTQDASEACDQLVQGHDAIIEAAWRELLPALVDLLEAHSAARDVAALCRNASQALLGAFTRAAHDHLGGYDVQPDAARAQIGLAKDIGYEMMMFGAGARSEIAGVDYARLYDELGRQIRIRLLALTEVAVDQCRAALLGLVQSVARKQEILRACEQRLLEAKAALRSDITSPRQNRLGAR